MRNLLNKKLKNEKGLTLIELLAVIVILAIIALIAIPAIGNIISNSKSKAILSDATTIIAGAKTAIADGACDGTTEKPCDNKALKDFVEDVKNNSATYTVTKSATNEYSIAYTEFSKLNEDYKAAIDYTNNATAIAQSKIAKAMGNKPEKPEKTEKTEKTN
ncbi:prepilin-type N-terminal cleavage/methylation domain-containing protein [Kurthia gibsonii]|uniref:prepilin-type N-terminal cleavage/methylation domain-containing protein n=1 Tax=Kurthia gibsonii TaxID=33946 RepID=UPI0030D593F5